MVIVEMLFIKNIKTAEEKLYFYEEKLGLYKKKKLLEDIIKDIDNEEIKNKNKGDIMTSRKYKMYYDYSKRTSGGFLDAMFLCGIMISASVLVFLALLGGK